MWSDFIALNVAFIGLVSIGSIVPLGLVGKLSDEFRTRSPCARNCGWRHTR